MTSVERDYFSSEPVNFNETDIDSDGHYKGGSFTFYMLENRKAAKDEIKTYEQRELQVKIRMGQQVMAIKSYEWRLCIR